MKGIGARMIVSALVPFAYVATAWGEYRIVEVEQGVTIRGVAKWQGEIPAIPPIIVHQQKDACGKIIESPVLQVDPATKGVRFVLIYLESIERGKAPKPRYVLHVGKHEARLHGRPCQFEEHIFPFVRRSELVFQNYEKILHTVHAFDEHDGTLFNIVLNNPGQSVISRQPGIQNVGVRFQCDAHPHMQGWMAGFDHPYFDTTDQRGHFEISDVPPGTYTLVAWHEGYMVVGSDEFQRLRYDAPHIVKQPIEVTSGETVEIEFAFPVR